MSAFTRTVYCIAGILLFPFAAMALDVSDVSGKWSPWIDAEGDVGLHRSLGQLDAFSPILQGENSFIFLNPRFRFDDDGGNEYNLGIGYRTLWNNRAVLGAYAYFDRQYSDNGNYFSQGTFGVEALSRDWKLRVNDYEPLGRKEATGINPTAVLTGGSLQIQSNSEIELRGNDAEIGYRIPVYETASFRQLWIYGGAYRFEGNDARLVAGQRARVEYEVRDIEVAERDLRLRLSAEWQHDSVRDTQGFIGLRIGIPLGGSGRHSQTNALTALERHMEDPIQRDVDIVTGTGSIREPAVNAYTGQTIGNVVTVSAADNIQSVATAAGNRALLIFDGSAGVISSNAITMSAGQTFLSGNSKLDIIGKNTGVRTSYTSLLPPATISGIGVGGGVITLSPSSMVNGLTINNTFFGALDSNAIGGNNISNAVVMNTTTSTVSPASYGISLVNSTNSKILNNTWNFGTGLDDGAIKVNHSDNVLIAGNSIIINNVSNGVDAFGIGVINSSNTGIYNNTITVNPASMGINVSTNANMTINGNTITVTGTDAYGLVAQGLNNLSANNNFVTANNSQAGSSLTTNTNLSGINNQFFTSTNVPLCSDGGGNSGSIGFIGGGHCP